jgi:hypothetical protein
MHDNRHSLAVLLLNTRDYRFAHDSGPIAGHFLACGLPTARVEPACGAMR